MRSCANMSQLWNEQPFNQQLGGTSNSLVFCLYRSSMSKEIGPTVTHCWFLLSAIPCTFNIEQIVEFWKGRYLWGNKNLKLTDSIETTGFRVTPHRVEAVVDITLVDSTTFLGNICMGRRYFKGVKAVVNFRSIVVNSWSVWMDRRYLKGVEAVVDFGCIGGFCWVPGKYFSEQEIFLRGCCWLWLYGFKYVPQKNLNGREIF